MTKCQVCGGRGYNLVPNRDIQPWQNVHGWEIYSSRLLPNRRAEIIYKVLCGCQGEMPDDRR
jgi:hypothetical protein